MTDRILMSKQLKDPNFFGSHDLVTGVDDNGQPIYGELTLTIRDVVQEEVNDMELIKTGRRNSSGGQTKLAYVMYFEENIKPYIVKAAVVISALERATGTKVVNRWVGKKVTFYVETGVYMPGTKKSDNITTDALRVRPYAQTTAKLYTCVDCGDAEVEERIAVYAQKKFGVVVCAACGKKRSENNG